MEKELGRILIDIGKLVIGGVILAGLMKQDINPIYLFTIGGALAICLISLGLMIYKITDKTK
ncbi:MAG: hypothetical protein FWH18_11500 [Marinilabiliaceae bacterium]|nr:hypothetical protein [Marinilabiliaceae bacterium]